MNENATNQYIKNIIIKSANLFDYTDNEVILSKKLSELTNECFKMEEYIHPLVKRYDLVDKYSSMTQWQQDIFDILNTFNNSYFYLDQVYQFEPIFVDL